METEWYREFLLQTRSPAFCVENGRVCAVNAAAEELPLRIGDDPAEILPPAREEASGDSEDCLVWAGDRLYRLRSLEREGVSVCTLLPPDPVDQPTLASLVRVSGNLRMITQELGQALDLLCSDPPEPSGDVENARRRGLRSLYRLERTASYLSLFCTLSAGEWQVDRQKQDLFQLFDGMCRKADDLLRYKDLRLTADFPKRGDFVCLDARLLEICFWELLANAASHTETGEIRLEVRLSADGILTLLFANRTDGEALPDKPFARFRTLPEAEALPGGAGFGLEIVSLAARAHGGRLLLGTGPDGTVQALLSLQTERSRDLRLEGPRLMPVSGLDFALVALSGTLPIKAFDPVDLL